MKRFYLLDQELKPAGELLYIDAEEAPEGYAGFAEFLEAKAEEPKKEAKPKEVEPKEAKPKEVEPKEAKPKTQPKGK